MNQLVAPDEVYDELDLGSARGGRAGINRPPLTITLTRALTQDDLPAIIEPPPVSQAQPVVKALRHSHHRLAQLLAEGKAGTEIALLTGYSQSYLTQIQGDPAFEELVSYYASQRTSIFVDAQERLKALGLDAVEMLHEKIHSPTEVWSKKELAEVIKMALPAETGAGQKLAINRPDAGSGAGFSLEVKFVSAGSSAPGPTIDSTFRDITPS